MTTEAQDAPPDRMLSLGEEDVLAYLEATGAEAGGRAVSATCNRGLRRSAPSPPRGPALLRTCWRARRSPSCFFGMTGIAVVVPARDEGAALGDSLESLARQTLRPDLIVVVVNNSSDATESVAREFAARPGSPATDVLVMPGRNKFRKAGALNYGIRHLIGLRRRRRDGQAALHRAALPADNGRRHRPGLAGSSSAQGTSWRPDRHLGRVSAACLGKRVRGATRWSRLLLLMQRIEYGRFTASRLRRDVHTMSGAGSLSTGRDRG